MVQRVLAGEGAMGPKTWEANRRGHYQPTARSLMVLWLMENPVWVVFCVFLGVLLFLIVASMGCRHGFEKSPSNDAALDAYARTGWLVFCPFFTLVDTTDGFRYTADDWV